MIYMYLFYDILDGMKHYTGQQEQFVILLSFLGPSCGYKKTEPWLMANEWLD